MTTLLTQFVPVLLLFGAAPDDKVLADLSRLDPAHITLTDAKMKRIPEGLRVDFGHANNWPGITFLPPEGSWDLSGFANILVEVRNVGSKPVEPQIRVDSLQGKRAGNIQGGRTTLQPGESAVLTLALRAQMPEAIKDKLFGMRGYPGGFDEKAGIDLEHVTRVLVFLGKPTDDHSFEILGVRLAGERPTTPKDIDRLFPMIDTFGQYIHRDWPGKVKSADDLRRHAATETADLAQHPAPSAWNQYGGWNAGPKLEATGFFRAQKHNGRWWLVDPSGRLFWSHGVDCVRPSNASTPITDREFYFAALPEQDSPLARFYGKASGAAHGYYENKRNYRTYNFTAANLLRKYGDNWPDAWRQRVHERLRSWGMNTIANWSDSDVYLMRRTPYTANVSLRGAPMIEGSQGYWGKFVDPFAPEFAAALREGMERERGQSVGDPWCVGYFIGNELSWGDDTSLAVAALQSPATQPAKKALLEDLKKKYGEIGRLNKAWGSSYASWQAMLESTEKPDMKRAAEDLGAFYSRIADRYFEHCRNAVKQAAPEQLYLGCRFAWNNDRAVRAGAKYCDVVSFNRYRRTVSDLKLPEGCDKPIVIGEFHFGALDRGMFHTGLVPTPSQEERADAYKTYLRSALEHPLIVGTHWFQLGDQATTGRSDGENYQIGLLDVCDTPYPETIGAVREVGYRLYETRSAAEIKP
ncbi:MAG: beta-agarase [Planctomycetota bacterium]